MLANYTFDLSLGEDEEGSSDYHSFKDLRSQQLDGTLDGMDNLLAELQELAGPVGESQDSCISNMAPNSSSSEPISPYVPLTENSEQQPSMDIGQLNMSAMEEKDVLLLRSQTHTV